MPVSDQITSFEAIPATYPRHINNTKPRLLPLACPVLNIFQIEQYQLTEKAVSIKASRYSVIRCPYFVTDASKHPWKKPTASSTTPILQPSLKRAYELLQDYLIFRMPTNCWVRQLSECLVFDHIGTDAAFSEGLPLACSVA